MVYILQTLSAGKLYKVTTELDDREFQGLVVLGKYMLLFPLDETITTSSIPTYVFSKSQGSDAWDLLHSRTTEIRPTEASLQRNSGIEIFLVEAHRIYGEHSYVVGTTTSFESAKEMAMQEDYCRGGKYECIVKKTSTGSSIFTEVWRSGSPSEP